MQPVLTCACVRASVCVFMSVLSCHISVLGGALRGKGGPHRHQVDTWRQKGFGWMATLQEAEGRGLPGGRTNGRWWASGWQEETGSAERTRVCVLHGPIQLRSLFLIYY